MQRHIGLGDIAAAWRAYGIIKELQPDILHGHGAKGGVYSRMFGSLLRVFRFRVARLYTAHGGSLHYDERTATGKLFFALERLMARFTDYILFVSEYERGAFHRKVGEPDRPSGLVYNGLREAEFEKVPAAPDAADFLYIGMMRDLKGPDLFIDALAQAEMRLGRKVTAVMVGDGEHLPRYEAQVRRLGLDDRVRFLKPMPARQAFALAGIVVVPSRAEAMPYIVLEALAAGSRSITTRGRRHTGNLRRGRGESSRADPDALAAEQSADALADPASRGRRWPSGWTIRARFARRCMAAEIEKAYHAALRR